MFHKYGEMGDFQGAICVNMACQHSIICYYLKVLYFMRDRKGLPLNERWNQIALSCVNIRTLWHLMPTKNKNKQKKPILIRSSFLEEGKNMLCLYKQSSWGTAQKRRRVFNNTRKKNGRNVSSKVSEATATQKKTKLPPCFIINPYVWQLGIALDILTPLQCWSFVEFLTVSIWLKTEWILSLYACHYIM